MSISRANRPTPCSTTARGTEAKSSPHPARPATITRSNPRNGFFGGGSGDGGIRRRGCRVGGQGGGGEGGARDTGKDLAGAVRRAGRGAEDYEQRLQNLYKEEAAVHARMRRRAQFSRRGVRNLIALSVLGEVPQLSRFLLL